MLGFVTHRTTRYPIREAINRPTAYGEGAPARRHLVWPDQPSRASVIAFLTLLAEATGR